jgi:hypothetical protein
MNYKIWGVPREFLKSQHNAKSIFNSYIDLPDSLANHSDKGAACAIIDESARSDSVFVHAA